MTTAALKDVRCVRAEFARTRDGRWVKLVPPQEGAGAPPIAAPLRVARQLAFAHRIEQRIAACDLRDRAEAARELGVSRARMTQILNLTLLAPDIQEEILFTEVEPGYQPINEHALRWVLRARDWPTQRARWRDLNDI